MIKANSAESWFPGPELVNVPWLGRFGPDVTLLNTLKQWPLCTNLEFCSSILHSSGSLEMLFSNA